MAKPAVAASKAVAIKDEGAVALPDFMKGQAGQGMGTEALGSADVEVPRVKLMQQLSPELQEYNELKAGDFFHTLAERNMGDAVRISPVFIDQRYLLWRPQESGGGILARADDGIHWNPPNSEFQVKLKSGKDVVWKTAPTVAASGLDKWGSSNSDDPNSPPAATRMYNMVVTFPDDPDMPPAVVTLQRSAIKVARRFIGKLKITRAPSFGLVFRMTSYVDINGAGQKFHNYAFKADGLVTDQEFYTSNFEFYKHFKSQGVNLKDLEDAQNDENEIPADNAPDGAPAI